MLSVENVFVNLLHTHRAKVHVNLLLYKTICAKSKSKQIRSFPDREKNIVDVWRLKGTVSRDFRLLVFFTNQFLPSP